MMFLTLNGYPRKFVKAIHRDFLHPPSREQGKDPPKQFVSIPYLKGWSEGLAKVCRSFGIGIRHKPFNTIRQQLRSAKDTLPKSVTRDTVYSVPCKDCPSKYVGETGRQQKTRNQAHDYLIRSGKRNTGMSTHALSQGHSFDFDATVILEKESKIPIRLIKERFHMHLTEDHCCLREEQKFVHQRWLDLCSYLHGRQHRGTELTMNTVNKNGCWKETLPRLTRTCGEQVEIFRQ